MINDIWITLQSYFEYSFVQNALIVSVLISLCSAIIGVSLVLKRFSFIGESLSHTTFMLMCVGSVIGLLDNIFVMLVIIIILSCLLSNINNNSKLKGDSILTVLSVSSLAFGYFVMSISNTSSNLAADVCSTLFGSVAILSLTRVEVKICIALAISLIAIYIIFYNKIFGITFDEEYSKATGVKVNLYNSIINITLSIVVVLAVNLVGSMLISAFIIFPALASMRVFKSYKMVTISSIIFSVVCSTVGIILSLFIETPVGSTIVLVDLIGFIIFYIIGLIRR